MPLPADFLLPLFVLTLLANAILVAVAIRGIVLGRYDPDRHGGPGRRPDIDRAGPAGRRDDSWSTTDPRQRLTVAPVASLAVPLSVEAVRPASPPEPSTDGAERAAPSALSVSAAGDGASATTDPGPSAEPAPSAEPELPAGAAPRPKRRRTAKGTDPVAATIKLPRAEPKRGRRRFSLPPLDDDHERVSRSIESFLTGVDPTAESAAPAQASAAGGGATDGATTVAIVLVDGLPDGFDAGGPGGARRSARGASRPGPVADALAMVERTLRAAARGTDVVTVGDHGRFQIVLASTGELAARAYLRRIRSAIEPRLETSVRPLRLVVATATVLDEPPDVAVERAEHRLAIALGSSRSARVEAREDASRGTADDADDEGTAPRAAAD